MSARPITVTLSFSPEMADIIERAAQEEHRDAESYLVDLARKDVRSLNLKAKPNHAHEQPKPNRTKQ